MDIHMMLSTTYVIDSLLLFKSSAAAFISTLFCTWLLRPFACHIGLVDRPGGRKWHQDNIPLIGGIAMFFGFCFTLLILPFSLNDYRGLLAGSGLLILIGVMDDFRELSSKLRLLVQVFACFFLTFWGQKYVSNLGNLFFFGDIHLGRYAIPITIFAILGFINAMNMVDGQDGLAGGIALTQTIPLLFLSILLNRPHDTMMLFILTVLLGAFLLFNMPLPWRNKASIFLGDAGSTFIAFIISWFAIDISQANVHLIRPMTVLWILALPLFDLINVCSYRINNGISPFAAGRDHLHHILQMHGIKTSLSTLLLCLLSLTFGLIGITFNMFEVADGWSFIAYISTLALYLYFIKVVRDK
jgi:UDP-GlcNAc:undecaprenyl-phosphate GlcNAc-1-phosphate transferase